MFLCVHVPVNAGRFIFLMPVFYLSALQFSLFTPREPDDAHRRTTTTTKRAAAADLQKQEAGSFVAADRTEVKG